jgi:2-oxoglutarate dehydrogenase E2 component (dihydrolipoamide succinyltransferase)
MTDVVIPRIGESIQTVVLSRWLRAPGDAVAEGDPLVSLDSDKASLDVPSPVSGVLREVLSPDGAEVPIGAVVARIEEGAVAALPAGSPPAPVRAGPAARQAAGEKGIDLGAVSGSGPRGRVTTVDLAAPAAPQALPSARTPSGAERRVPMSPLRRTIARRLLEATQQTAMLTTFNEVDCSAMMSLRKAWQDDFVARHGVKLGFMSFFVKAVIEALKEYPAVNAEIDGDTIVYKDFWHIGVAVSGPRGLVVPVLRDADRLSFAETEKAIAALSARAKENRLLPADFEGGTFTVSNGGVFGSLMSTPILNPPQVGILGMHAIVERPIGIGGQIALRPMMYVALSYDHRLVDGREGVGFLARVKQCVEHPERILLDV